MNIVTRILNIVDSISEWTGKLVAFLILPTILFICFDVTMRYIFNMPTNWANELSCFCFGTLWVIGGAYALKNDNHVKMEVLYNRLAPRIRAIVDIITAPLFFIFVGILIWKGWEFALSSLLRLEHSGSFWSPPIYPVKMIIPIGAFLLMMQGLTKFIRDVVKAFSGKEI